MKKKSHPKIAEWITVPAWMLKDFAQPIWHDMTVKPTEGYCFFYDDQTGIEFIDKYSTDRHYTYWRQL